MLNFDRPTVKQGTQNIQNDCHQWLSDLECRLLSGLREPTSKGDGSEREREGDMPGRGREREGRGTPLRKFLDPPLFSARVSSYCNL